MGYLGKEQFSDWLFLKIISGEKSLLLNFTPAASYTVTFRVKQQFKIVRDRVSEPNK